MNNSVISKYFLWKKKVILAYSKMIETLVSTENNNIWKNRKEFDLLCKNIINEYVDKYLFNEEEILKDDGIDIEIKSKELDKIFLAISDYFKKINSLDRINDNKKETLLLTMIIYSASSLDQINSVFNTNIDYLETINKLLDDYKEMKLFKVKKTHETQVGKLIELLKTNRLKEKAMFDSLTDSSSYNKYISVCKEKNLFIVEYNYYIQGLERYSKTEVNSVFGKKDVYDELSFISVDLIINTILKEISLRRKISKYAIVVYKNFYKKSKNLSRLSSTMCDLKKNISLLISYEDYISDMPLIDKVRSYGFNIIVDTHLLESFDIKKINNKDNILVNKTYNDINKDRLFIIDDGKILTENELLNIKTY